MIAIDVLISSNYQEKDMLIEGKVDWKGRAVTKYKGGMRAAFLILGRIFGFLNIYA